MNTNCKIESNVQNEFNSSSLQIQNLASEFKQNITTIKVREIDKRYTHANLNFGRCTQDCCSNISSHWLTRQNSDYCQSDLICNRHAKLWTQVRDLLA